jgi:hypothetical protein
MPIEKSPPSPVPDNVVPTGGVPYKVKSGDTLVSIAKAYSIDEWELNDFNWKTGNPYNPAEVNWYLKEYVGCAVPTHDKANWKFTSGLTGGRGVWKGGVIYLPRKWEIHALLPKATTNALTNSADKGDCALPAKIKQEYGLTLGTVHVQARVDAAKIAITGVLKAFRSSGQATAARLLELFLANKGQSVSYPDGGPESNRLKADRKFQTVAQDLYGRVKLEVKKGLAGSVNPIVIRSNVLVPIKDTFAPDDQDLHLAFGRFQGVEIEGKGYHDRVDVRGELHFKYSIIYGFGVNDANRWKFGLKAGAISEVAKQARLLQLAAEAAPLMDVTIAVSIKVP